MLAYKNVEERKATLAKLAGIEDRVWVMVGDFEPVFAIADEDCIDRTKAKRRPCTFSALN
ncbi:MAG: DUF3501 family protein [Gammaproteobacteria bacterium]|nr:DUF3501 family protein [Gammaproteobacteria bacterium]MCI0591416.1 DUF3501 family protein [Gammaproteobacteria bacterium]